MRRNQIIVVGFCAVLLVGLYFFGKTNKPKDESKAPVADGGHMPQGQAQEAPEALNIEAYISDVNLKVTDTLIKKNIEKFSQSRSYRELIQQYQKLDKPLAIAYYSIKLAETEHKADAFVGAGDYNSMLLQTAPDEKARKYLSTNAIDCYRKALDMDTSNTENRIRLAGAYMADGAQPMQGVGILLDIVRKDSNNVDAQLMLGKFGLISGQIDKAIARFEKILYLQPQNSEALFMLAQAYTNKGEKKKALELLEKCKKTVKDPEAKKEIERTIENIKK
ncbi:MAG: hypothetical protein JWO06_146 [Bacteroidota bacterium]|nr:hypothetical protein [Bacteroidota bacterium]